MSLTQLRVRSHSRPHVMTDYDHPPPVGHLGRCRWDEAEGCYHPELTEEGQRFVADWLAEWKTVTRLMKKREIGLVRMYTLARNLGYSEEEIESAGLVGLTKAAIWWNKERASNFSTAIVWRLKEALGKLVNRTRNEDAWEQRTSLDAPITDSEDTIAKLVADDRLPPLPYDSLDAVRNMMRTLPRTHRIVIQLRYLGHEQRTLEQIAAYFGFSKERARQYEDAALEMLRRRMAEGEKEC